MRKSILLIIALIALSIGNTQEVLTNQSIIDLTELGFEEQVIIDKIESSETNFDTTIGALKTLKEKNIGSSILSAMIKAGENLKDNEELTNQKDKSVGENNGLYFKGDKIKPEIVIGYRTGASAGIIMTGIGNVYTDAILVGAKSQLLCSPYNLKFDVIFEGSDSQKNDFATAFTVGINSISDFVLIKLRERRKKRTFRVGKTNGFETSFSIQPEDIIPFDVSTEDNVNFEISMNRVLEDGHYAFVPRSSATYINSKVWTFSVSK